MRGRRGAGLVHVQATRLLSAAMVLIGVLLIARAAALTVVLGVLFIAGGAGRLWLSARGRSAGEE